MCIEYCFYRYQMPLWQLDFIHTCVCINVSLKVYTHCWFLNRVNYLSGLGYIQYLLRREMGEKGGLFVSLYIFPLPLLFSLCASLNGVSLVKGGEKECIMGEIATTNSEKNGQWVICQYIYFLYNPYQPINIPP